MEHLYYPTGVSKLSTVGGKVTDYLDYNMQMKLQGNAGMTLSQLVSQISPEGKVSAYWFGPFPADSNIGDKNVILRTTSQYDMPVLSPTVRVLDGDTFKEVARLADSSSEVWDYTSWRYVQESSIGAITQELIDEARECCDESVGEEIWNENKFGSSHWDSKLLLGKSIPMYAVRDVNGLSMCWENQPELCASLNLLFPTLVDRFSVDSDESNPYFDEFLNTNDYWLKPEYEHHELIGGVFYQAAFKLDNLAISLEQGYAAFGNFESVSPEVLNVPLGMLYPFLITAYFTHSLEKAEKAFPDFSGLFKSCRKIPESKGYAAAFWKPYYNLCSIFGSNKMKTRSSHKTRTYFPPEVSKLPVVGGPVVGYLEDRMQRKFQGANDVTLSQLVPRISPEGKVSAHWFKGFTPYLHYADDPLDYFADRQNVILRTTTQYDMPVFSPTVKIEPNDSLQAIKEQVEGNRKVNRRLWEDSSWLQVQEESIGAITQSFINKARRDNEGFESWDESKFGPIKWDDNLLLGKSIPMYNVVNYSNTMETWSKESPELLDSLDLLFPTQLGCFSDSMGPYPSLYFKDTSVTSPSGALKPEYRDNKIVLSTYRPTLFGLDNLAISLEQGYAAFGGFEATSSEVLNIPLSLLYPFLITTYFTKSLNKAEKAFPNLQGLFKTSRKISTTIGGFSEMFWKPYYNLCGIFDN